MKAAVLFPQRNDAVKTAIAAAQGGSRHEAESVSTNFDKE